MFDLIKINIFKFILGLSLVGISSYFFIDRVGGLFQSPYQSAIRGWDDSFYFYWLRSFIVDGDFDFSNDIVYCNTFDEETRQHALSMPLTESGYLPNKYPVGWAMSSAPWYFVGATITRVINFFGVSLLKDGYGPFYQLFIMIGQWIYGGLSLFFAYKVCRRFFNSENAFLAVAITWSASSLFYYQNIQLSMTHNLSFFAITGCYWVTLTIREKTNSLFLWTALAMFSATVILSRLQGAVYLVYPAVVILKLLHHDKKLIPFIIIFLIVGTLALLPQVYAWKVLYGQYLPYTYGDEGFNWLAPALGKVLFSSYHGWVYWTPLILIALFGFFYWIWKSRNIEATTWTLALLATVYINASWHDWTFGASFGARAFEGATLFAMVGLGNILQLTEARIQLRNLFIILCLFFSLWNINLTLLVRFWKYSGITLTQSVTYEEIINGSYKFWFEKD